MGKEENCVSDCSVATEESFILSPSIRNQSLSPGVDNQALSPTYVTQRFSPNSVSKGPTPRLRSQIFIPIRSPAPAITEVTVDKVPLFENYQLIGDSLLLRFSEQILFQRCQSDPHNGARALGLCVSGQTIAELWNRLCSSKYSVSDRAVLLIGTNDMLRDTDMVLMKKRYRAVVKSLGKMTEKLVLLTLPPVPRLAHKLGHWERLEMFNNYVKEQAKKRMLHVADITPLYLKGLRRCRNDYFESFYGNRTRVDRVHLNRRGLECLHTFLIESKMLDD